MVRLIIIPISRFCEKARWALERAGIAYREGHLQVSTRSLRGRASARRSGTR
jgi:glutathione S-transferase